MASSSTNGTYNGRKQVLGADGKPWQRQYGFDEFQSLPYPAQFQSLTGSGNQAFQMWLHDEALKHDHEFCNSLRNDAYLASLIDERKMAPASLEWHLEIEDERDPRQVAVRDGLTAWVKRVPYFQKLIEYLLEATWQGRYGAQLQIDRDWQTLSLPSIDNPEKRVPMRCPRIYGHTPIDGDSIGHKFDGTPLILINSAVANQIPGADIVNTSRGRALAVNGSWRNKFILHAHKLQAGFFNDPSTAERAFGLGLRNQCYWWQWLKMEYMGSVTDWVQRMGLGVRLWKFAAGNDASKRAVMAAAAESSGDKVNLFIPVYNDRGTEGVEFLEPTSSGAQIFLQLQEYIDKILERAIVGQSMSGGSDEGNGLGGTGRADLAASTKAQNTRFDAQNLSETLTDQLVLRGLRWIYPPDCHDVPVSFKFVMERKDPEKVMAAVKKVVQMGLGGKIRAEDVVGLTGLPIAKEGDFTVADAMQAQQAQQQAQQMQAAQQQNDQSLLNDVMDQFGGEQPGQAQEGQAVQYSAEDWTPLPDGPRGGKRWRHTSGRIQYGPNNPGGGGAGKPAAEPKAAGPKEVGAALGGGGVGGQTKAKKPYNPEWDISLSDDGEAEDKAKGSSGKPSHEGDTPETPATVEDLKGLHPKEAARHLDRIEQAATDPRAKQAITAAKQAIEGDAEGGKESPRAKEEKPLLGDVKRAKALGGGVNSSSILTMADGAKGVWKPASGENPKAFTPGVPKGTLHRRETATSHIAGVLGLDDLVPATVTREVDGQEGSCQSFIGKATTAGEMLNPFDGPDDLGRAAAFDFLTGQGDRHPGNWMLTDKPGVMEGVKKFFGAAREGDKLKLIDNGMSLPTEELGDHFRNNDLLREAADAKVPDLSAWVGKWGQVAKSMKANNIEDEAIALAKRRFDNLIEVHQSGGTFGDLEYGQNLVGTKMMTVRDQLNKVARGFRVKR